MLDSLARLLRCRLARLPPLALAEGCALGDLPRLAALTLAFEIPCVLAPLFPSLLPIPLPDTGERTSMPLADAYGALWRVGTYPLGSTLGII